MELQEPQQPKTLTSSSSQRKQCPYCRETFSSKSILIRHKKRKHAEMKAADVGSTEQQEQQEPKTSTSSSSGKRQCPYCSEILSSAPSLSRHKKRRHADMKLKAAEAGNKDGKIHCDICGTYKCTHIQELIKHQNSAHHKNIKISSGKFSTEKEFQEWKKDVEEETSCTFLQQCGIQKNKTGNVVYYYCHRSGKVNLKTVRQRALKSQGSHKINNVCTAYMIARQRAGEESVVVDYCLHHIGHEPLAFPSPAERKRKRTNYNRRKLEKTKMACLEKLEEIKDIVMNTNLIELASAMLARLRETCDIGLKMKKGECENVERESSKAENVCMISVEESSKAESEWKSVEESSKAESSPSNNKKRRPDLVQQVTVPGSLPTQTHDAKTQTQKSNPLHCLEQDLMQQMKVSGNPPSQTHDAKTQIQKSNPPHCGNQDLVQQVTVSGNPPSQTHDSKTQAQKSNPLHCGNQDLTQQIKVSSGNLPSQTQANKSIPFRCAICFQVDDTSGSTIMCWYKCVKCSRMLHVACAPAGNNGRDALCLTCQSEEAVESIVSNVSYCF